MKALAFASLIAAMLLSVEARAQSCSTLPVLFIAQDRSGSMADPPDPTCTNCNSKWADSTAAVTSLTTTYSNRFRFGLGLFPGNPYLDQCSAGGVFATIGASSATIQQTYQQTGPLGGTPTAATLQATLQYLQSQSLNTPTYVLLITDGLPNCNTANDPTTCVNTANTCVGYSFCCLDDSPTRQAAAALYAAGIKVYVVGFGADTAGNNKTVLDGVAQAGGTGSAYSATDQATLTSVLATIASQTTTCCTNACAEGATQCAADGQQMTCQLGTNGCTNWTTHECTYGSSCTGGNCVTCNSECTAGAERCTGTTAEKCVVGPTGCASWQQQTVCGNGQGCVNGTCQSCGVCTPGAQRCNGNTPETCALSEFGCAEWQPGAACSSFCSGGVCGSCGPACNVGDIRCNGNTVEQCEVDANGCSAYVETQSCVAGQVCAEGSCRQSCTSGGEFSSCADGYSCESTAGGSACVPVDGGVGAPEELEGSPASADGGSGAGSNAGPTKNGSIDLSSKGCAAAPGLPFMLVGLLTLATRRRARVNASRTR